MMIHSIELQNFRPFYGRHTLNLTPESGRPVTLVKALNDVGKTSLFAAFKFCLYGERRSKLASLVNRSAAHESDGQMSVRINFDHDGSRYEIVRTVEYRRATSLTEEPVLKGDDPLLIIKDGVIQMLKTIEQENEFIEAILPADASRFFFFDGEQIQVYTKHPPEERVREAIEIVLGIRELLNARDDLQQVGDEVRRELNRLLKEQSKDAEEARQLEGLEEEVSSLKVQIENLDQQISHAEEVVQRCDAQLAKASEIREKVEKRKRLDEDLENVKKQIESVFLAQRLFNKYAGPLLLTPVLEILSSTAAQETQTTVPGWKREAAKHVLGSGVCICGRSIDEHAAVILRPHAAQEMKTSEEILSDAAFRMLRILEPKSREQELLRLIETAVQLEEDKRDLKAQQENLHQDLRGVREGDIKQYEETRFKACVDIERLHETKKKKNEDLRENESDHNNRQRRLAGKTVSRDVKAKQNLLDTCSLVRDSICEVIEKLVDSRRSQVATLATKVFKQLTNNPALYEGILIENDYSLKVQTVGGIARHVWVQAPSAGASQILATAFIAALNRYTAREAPVVIDTPIGRLDPVHKRNLLSFFPEFGPQVIILHQPEELDDNDVRMLRSAVNSEWEITRSHDNPDNSTIRRVS